MTEQSARVKARQRHSTNRRVARNAIGRRVGQGLDSRQVRLLRRTFAQIELQSSIAGLIFYQKLFSLEPALRELFHTSVELQTRKLMESLHYVVVTLEKPKALVPMLEGLGRRHLMYGVREWHYDLVIKALLETFKDLLGDHFTEHIRQAWHQALTFVADTMKRGARKVDVELGKHRVLALPPKRAIVKPLKRLKR